MRLDAWWGWLLTIALSPLASGTMACGISTPEPELLDWKPWHSHQSPTLSHVSTLVLLVAPVGLVIFSNENTSVAMLTRTKLSVIHYAY